MIYGERGSVCEKVADGLKRDIDAGVYSAGEKLPSCRELASELGINPNTVSKAFSILEKQGYIEILPQKGAYAKVSPMGAVLEKPLGEIERAVESAKTSGASKEDIIGIVEKIYGDEND